MMAFAATSWAQAMVLIFPFLLMSSISGAGHRAWWRGVEPKVRAWLAMSLASAATFALDPKAGEVPFMVYACIDFLACMAVLASPSGLFSRLIGGLFFVMMLGDGIVAYQGSDGLGGYQWIMERLGVLMIVILVIWGTHDAGKSLAARSRRAGGQIGVGTALAASRQRSAGVVEP